MIGGDGVWRLRRDLPVLRTSSHLGASSGSSSVSSAEEDEVAIVDQSCRRRCRWRRDRPPSRSPASPHLLGRGKRRHLRGPGRLVNSGDSNRSMPSPDASRSPMKALTNARPFSPDPSKRLARRRPPLFGLGDHLHCMGGSGTRCRRAAAPPGAPGRRTRSWCRCRPGAPSSADPRYSSGPPGRPTWRGS